MKLAIILMVSAAMTMAQDVAVPTWRAGLSTLPAAPPANTSDQDVAQFEKNMRMAAVYLANNTPTAGPAQWEANRAMVRRMATYLYGLRALSGNNGQLRGSVNRAQRSFDSLGLAEYLALAASTNGGYYQDGEPPSAPAGSAMPRQQQSAAPPFALQAPELTGVPDADKDEAAELVTRYETDAATSAGIWQNAETVRQSLEARGMGLNLQTATSMVRLPQHLNAAAHALRRNDWSGARTHLEQAEAETQKMAKTVGR